MSYTSQTEIEAHMGRDLTAAEITMLPYVLAQTDKTIEDITGATFGSVAETSRFYDGGYRTLPIEPAYAISAVQVVDTDQANTVEDTYDLGEDLEIYPLNDTPKTYLQKRSGRFPGGLGVIKVTGNFSNTSSIPEEITGIATYIAAKSYSGSNTGDVQSESIEGYSRTYKQFDAKTDATVLAVLGSYAADDILL